MKYVVNFTAVIFCPVSTESIGCTLESLYLHILWSVFLYCSFEHFHCHWINEQHICWVSDVVTLPVRSEPRRCQTAETRRGEGTNPNGDNESKVFGLWTCWFSEMLVIDKRIQKNQMIEVMSKKGCCTEKGNIFLYIFHLYMYIYMYIYKYINQFV